MTVMQLGVKFGKALLFGGGMALLVTACAGEPHAAAGGYEHRVNAALKEGRLDQVKPTWDQGAAAMRLTGIVQTDDERRQAETIAAGVLGHDVAIVNDLRVTLRGAPEAVPASIEARDVELIDARVKRDVEALFDDRDVWGGRDIEVLVREGNVRLTGKVLSQAEKDRITELVARVPGVREIINRLAVPAASDDAAGAA